MTYILATSIVKIRYVIQILSCIGLIKAGITNALVSKHHKPVRVDNAVLLA